MRKSSFIGKFQVLALKRLSSSYYESPKWEIAIQAISPFHSTRYIATTAKNAACGYDFSYCCENRVYEMEGYFSKKWNMIIEKAREVK